MVDRGRRPRSGSVFLLTTFHQAQAERTAVVRGTGGASSDAAALDVAEVHAMVDPLGDPGAVLGDARPASLQQLHQSLRRPGSREPLRGAACVAAESAEGSAGVRGGLAHEPPGSHCCSSQ